MDRQTRQTHDNGIYCTSITMHSKNNSSTGQIQKGDMLQLHQWRWNGMEGWLSHANFHFHWVDVCDHQKYIFNINFGNIITP